nr:MAG TPA: hypothetical protein [Ackermannviridae sp.]
MLSSFLYLLPYLLHFHRFHSMNRPRSLHQFS